MKVEHIMSSAVLAIGFLYLFLVTFLPVPAAGAEHAKTIVGFMLGSVISIIIGYWWGSSKGSADKAKVIENQINKP